MARFIIAIMIIDMFTCLPANLPGQHGNYFNYNLKYILYSTEQNGSTIFLDEFIHYLFGLIQFCCFISFFHFFFGFKISVFIKKNYDDDDDDNEEMFQRSEIFFYQAKRKKKSILLKKKK